MKDTEDHSAVNTYKTLVNRTERLNRQAYIDLLDSNVFQDAIIVPMSRGY